MNRAFVIIGIPAVGVATFYGAVLWGRWGATIVAVVMTAGLTIVATVESRRRRAAQQLASGQSRPPTAR